LPGLGEPFLASVAAALVGRAGGARVTRDRPAIAQIAHEGFAHQQFRRRDANAPDFGQ